MNLPKNLSQRGHAALILFFILAISIGIVFFLLSPQKKQILSQFTTTPVSTAQVKSATASAFVSKNGTKLVLNGQPYQFIGINAYQLATLWGTNAGCGGQVSDLDGFFKSLRPNSAVRFWAFQGSIATNINTKQIDWTPLDRVVSAAEANDQKLIMALSGQSGGCDDGHWKDKAWYSGGYTQSYNDDEKGLAPIPFLDYAKMVVDRYKNSTAIAMWELVSEPETADCEPGFKGDGCYGHQLCNDEQAATNSLKSFFDNVGGQIKQIDPNHLIESGVIGDGQCGAIYLDYSYIHSSPGIDVASFHDYGRNDQPMPGDQWNGLQSRLDMMKAVNKPLVIGEVGMTALDNQTNCLSFAQRKDLFKGKMDAQITAGIAGFVPWDWVPTNQNICTFDILDGDPLLTLLHDYPLPQVSALPSPTPAATPSTSSRPTATPVPSPTLPATPGPTPTPISTPTPHPTPSPTPTPTPTLAPTPTPTPTPSTSSGPSASTVPTPASDTQPPTAPTNLQSNAISPSQINLSWDPSTDNSGIVLYEVFRNGNIIATINTTNFGDGNLSAQTNYSYYVKAVDGLGNESQASNTVNESTLAAPELAGIVSGIVYGSNNQALAGAKVMLKGLKNQITYTNALGFYTFTNLLKGNYQMQFQSKHFVKQTATIDVSNGQTATLNLSLDRR